MGHPKGPLGRGLEAGPDDRPLREQLVEHAQVMAQYFREFLRGLGPLQAAGIDPARANACPKASDSQPVQAYQAFVGWLTRTRAQGRIAACTVETVASIILGSLHGFATTAPVCG